LVQKLGSPCAVLSYHILHNRQSRCFSLYTRNHPSGIVRPLSPLHPKSRVDPEAPRDEALKPSSDSRQ